VYDYNGKQRYHCEQGVGGAAARRFRIVNQGEPMDTIDRFLQGMYGGARADFVFSVSRDDVRACKTPVLVMPDDSPPHPYGIAIESAMLAAMSEVGPWKDTKEKIPVAVRQVRTFMRAHQTAAA
jgi:hypothetical protein